jgi:probable HAF family extracellular repeat protein
MVSLGAPLGSNNVTTRSLNRDGTLVVGYIEYQDSEDAFQWTSAGGIVALPPLPGENYSEAWAVSSDGSHVAGWSGAFAVVWTSGAAPIALPPLPGDTLSTAYGISRDGTTVVGSSSSDARGDRPVRWVNGGPAISIPMVPGATEAIAWAANADGSVIVGYVNVDNQRHAFRWAAGGGMVSLGLGSAYGVSADGAAVVGVTYAWGGGDAFLWTAGGGLVPLNAYLPTLGINTSEWSLTDAEGISDDGRTIAGNGWHNTSSEAWIATLPPTCGSADFNHDGDIATDADIEAFFACLAGNCCPACGSADFNGDGDFATDADIEAFFRVLAGGAC